MYSVRLMCRVLKLHPSGYYAWIKNPISKREQEDQRLLVLIKEYYLASGGTYGSPWIYKDLREAGETCSVHRVAKIMRKHRIPELRSNFFSASVVISLQLPNITMTNHPRQVQHIKFSGQPGNRFVAGIMKG